LEKGSFRSFRGSKLGFLVLCIAQRISTVKLLRLPEFGKLKCRRDSDQCNDADPIKLRCLVGKNEIRHSLEVSIH
jgi:hypothetical protein